MRMVQYEDFSHCFLLVDTMFSQFEENAMSRCLLSYIMCMVEWELMMDS